MNIIFMRHGEASDNVKKLISDKEIYWSTLTEQGKQTVLESVKSLPNNISKMYVSPLPRTIQTAHYVYERFPNIEVIMENRIRELQYGKFSGQPNNAQLDEVREKQIAGDFFVRFGEYGENKFEIESRLCSFLKDLHQQNKQDSTLLIVSHGSVTSFMKRILKIQSVHIKTGKIEIVNNVDFTPLYDHIKMLENLTQNK